MTYPCSTLQHSLLIVLFLALAARPCLGQDSAHAYLIEGDDLYASYDNVGALRQFERAAKLAPGSFEVHHRLARVSNDIATDRFVAGDRDGAREAAERALEEARTFNTIFPSRAESWLFLAAASGNRALVERGSAKVRLGRDIERYCEKALELDSSYALPHLVLGIYYREIAGLSWVQRAVAHNLIGRLPKNAAARAVEHLTRAVKLNPELSVAHFQLAVTLDRTGQANQAKAPYHEALSKAPRNARDLRNQRLAAARLTELAHRDAAVPEAHR